MKLQIKRRGGFETFDVKAREHMTVADALLQLPEIAWDNACEWPACGACMMIIAGQARAACATRIEDVVKKNKPLVLEPLEGFAVVEDLLVDRSPIRGAGYRKWIGKPFTDCTECGACVDACPEDFVALRGDSFVQCGFAEACVAVCPESIPLDGAILGAAGSILKGSES